MPESSHRDVINVMPSLALDSSIHAGMTSLTVGSRTPKISAIFAVADEAARIIAD